MRILFILKDRFYNKSHSNSYGLINSSRQVAKYLEKLGHECKIVQVVDGNAIDRELFLYKPDLTIIEALWVTGEKLKELMEIKRYQHMKWVVRVHSNIGFLSAETLAVKYINDYIALQKDNLYVSFNHRDLNEHMASALEYDFVYLPNIITIKDVHKHKPEHKKTYMDIGCFGSLRVLKNQCYQALCAIDAANRLDKTLRFHITVDIGMEEGTNPVLKNLEEIFKNSRHELIKHSWLENEEFHELILKMDVGLQISFTESFNIVAADFVVNDTPIIVSDAIEWMPRFFKTSTVLYDQTIP